LLWRACTSREGGCPYYVVKRSLAAVGEDRRRGRGTGSVQVEAGVVGVGKYIQTQKIDV